MANHKSAKKSIRQIKTVTAINRSRKSRIHTFIRKVEDAIKAGNAELARSTFLVAESEIMRGVTKNVLKLNTASRKVSRLCARVKALAS